MTHKNPQRRKIFVVIDRSEDVFVDYPFCVISVAAVERRLFL